MTGERDLVNALVHDWFDSWPVQPAISYARDDLEDRVRALVDREVAAERERVLDELFAAFHGVMLARFGRCAARALRTGGET